MGMGMSILLIRGRHQPVGDTAPGPIRLSFNPQLCVEFRGATVTSDAGLLPRASWTNASV